MVDWLLVSFVAINKPGYLTQIHLHGFQVTAFHKKQVPIFAASLGGAVLEPSKGASSAPSHSSQQQLSSQLQQQPQLPQQQQQQQSTISPNASGAVLPKTAPVHPAPPELPPSLGGAKPTPALKTEPTALPAAPLVDTSSTKALGREEMKAVTDSKPLDRIKKVGVHLVYSSSRSSW